MSDHDGFTGTIKNQPQDFVVTEIDVDGRLVNACVDIDGGPHKPPDRTSREKTTTKTIIPCDHTDPTSPVSLDLGALLGPAVYEDLEGFFTKTTGNESPDEVTPDTKAHRSLRTPSELLRFAGSSLGTPSEVRPLGSSLGTPSAVRPVGSSLGTPSEVLPVGSSLGTPSEVRPVGSSLGTPSELLPVGSSLGTPSEVRPVGSSLGTPSELLPVGSSLGTPSELLPVGSSPGTPSELLLSVGSSPGTPDMLSLGSFPDKHQRMLVHRAVRHHFPSLMTITRGQCGEIAVRENPDHRELSALVTRAECDDFFRFVDAKAPGSSYTFGPDGVKEHRTAVHHFLSRRFGKLVETKSFRATNSHDRGGPAISVRLKSRKRTGKEERRGLLVSRARPALVPLHLGRLAGNRFDLVVRHLRAPSGGGDGGDGDGDGVGAVAAAVERAVQNVKAEGSSTTTDRRGDRGASDAAGAAPLRSSRGGATEGSTRAWLSLPHAMRSQGTRRRRRRRRKAVRKTRKRDNNAEALPSLVLNFDLPAPATPPSACGR
ncbi:hypothetical protein CRUP_006534 [Coryphaenoides rupestris]|nr:hypothetical protein CRUP_006534 [Coryphaenoides rupestris]